VLKLICQAGSKIGQQFKVMKPRFTIGRQAGNDLQLPSPFVSKFHAEIRRDENGAYWIEDLRSTNGTFIEKTEVNQATRLEAGNTIIVGKSDIFKIEISPESANIPVYFNINDNLDIQPEILKSKLKLSAMQQPTTRPVTGEADAPENVSDSWLDLMELGHEPDHEFKYPEDAFETQSLDPSKSNWPDVVKMSQKLDSYKKLYEIALELVALADRDEAFRKIEEILSRLLPIRSGVVVLHKRLNDPASWETRFLSETDHELMEISSEIHQAESGTASESFAYKSKQNGLLYHPLHDKKIKFGFVSLSASLATNGFLEHEKRAFRLVCQLLERTLSRFRKI
jgi:hypothetical protein